VRPDAELVLPSAPLSVCPPPSVPDVIQSCSPKANHQDAQRDPYPPLRRPGWRWSGHGARLRSWSHGRTRHTGRTSLRGGFHGSRSHWRRTTARSGGGGCAESRLQGLCHARRGGCHDGPFRPFDFGNQRLACRGTQFRLLFQHQIPEQVMIGDGDSRSLDLNRVAR
jgi:hypothetical protein